MKIGIIILFLTTLSNCEIFENWESFNNWEPEISATGGGNNEFQQYYLHPESAQLVNGTLIIKPLFEMGDLRDDIDLYALGCKNNWNNGCYSKGSMHWNKGELHYVNNKPVPVGGKRTKPFISTKLISKKSFGYGNLTVEFKLPKGNFLWPAIWMLPETKHPWPIGGEIDLIESMGNSPDSSFGLNYESVSSALHLGYKKSLYHILFTPFAEKIQKQSFNRKNLSDDWHKVSLYRSKNNLIITIDGNELLNCDKLFRQAALSKPRDTIYRDEIIKLGYLAGFRKYVIMMGEEIPDFLWKGLPYDAPFHENFNLIINLAIGGDFFGDSMNSDTNIAKPPWGPIENGLHPALQFLKNLESWYDWGKISLENNDVCTYPIEECIKDNLPCDKFKDCYLDSEKFISYTKPIIEDKTSFRIRKIYFKEF